MMVQKAARVGEAWNSIERSHRASLCQIQVKAGIERRIPLEDIDGRFKGAAVDDQACCRHNSVSMRLLDGLIDPPGKPQIVRRNDQLPFFKRRARRPASCRYTAFGGLLDWAM